MKGLEILRKKLWQSKVELYESSQSHYTRRLKWRSYIAEILYQIKRVKYFAVVAHTPKITEMVTYARWVFQVEKPRHECHLGCRR